jgi:hypothetical protein
MNTNKSGRALLVFGCWLLVPAKVAFASNQKLATSNLFAFIRAHS